jgi:uncharacterized membrane protein YtjA (UPF0391 family)
MLRASLAFFLVAILAAVFGFSGIAADAAWIGRFLFFLFLVGCVIFLVTGIRLRRTRLRVVHIAPRR